MLVQYCSQFATNTLEKLQQSANWFCTLFFWYFNLVLVCSVSSEQVTNCYSRNYSDVSGWGRQLIFFSDRKTVFLLKKLWACFFMKSSLMALLREKKMGVPITSRAYKSHLWEVIKDSFSRLLWLECFVWQKWHKTDVWKTIIFSSCWFVSLCDTIILKMS